MARTVRNAKLDSRSGRTKLEVRREPHWVVISKGCALGYRKTSGNGTWVARYRDDAGKQHYHSLGAADDAMDADGGGLCITYADAQRAADSWFKLAARGFEEQAPRHGAYTVGLAVDDYLVDYQRRGGKSYVRTKGAIASQISPSLGHIQLAKLSKRKIEAWHEDLAKAPARLRTKPGDTQKYRENTKGVEDLRRRKSTANRLLSVLKAALNFAYSNRHVSSDDAWRSVKPFREVDAARVRYLNDDESKRLVNACAEDFRCLVQAALLSGARYGELLALKVSDFNADSGTVHIQISKSGKPRHIVLSTEGQKFISQMALGKKPDALLFTRADNEQWGTSHQHRPFKSAISIAKLGAMSFHELRHTYASRLIMGGAPLAVVAAQLGHSDTRMVEKHYGHMAPSYVADTVRASFGEMGILEPSNVAPFRANI